MKGSYNIDSFTKNQKTEITRLKSQVELFYSQELEIYKRLGMKNGMKVMDCGCGTGILLFNLAENFPQSTFTGLEIDSFLFDNFQNNIIQYNTLNIKAKQGSIYQTGENDEFYDIVISRLVIEHLEKPDRALEELYRILKPGGKLIIVSNDFEYHVLTNPHIPELDLMYQAYCKSRINEGGNPYIGRELPYYLQNLGAQHLQINIATAHNRILGDKALLKAENINISRSLVKKGYLDQDTLDRLSNKWFEMLQDPKHVIYRQLFIVSGEKAINKELINENSSNDETDKLPTNQLDGLGDKNNKDELRLMITKKIMESFDDNSLKIEPSVKLNEYDIDSLTATDIASFLKDKFKINVKLTYILKECSVNDLIRMIIENDSFPGNQDNIEQSEWSEGEL